MRDEENFSRLHRFDDLLQKLFHNILIFPKQINLVDE